jgi:hypothetical protein
VYWAPPPPLRYWTDLEFNDDPTIAFSVYGRDGLGYLCRLCRPS